jgi:hypothetical protein
MRLNLSFEEDPPERLEPSLDMVGPVSPQRRTDPVQEAFIGKEGAAPELRTAVGLSSDELPLGEENRSVLALYAVIGLADEPLPVARVPGVRDRESRHGAGRRLERY